MIKISWNSSIPRVHAVGVLKSAVLYNEYMKNQRTLLLIITGTIGVGKSSVADEVFEILKAQAKPVALVNFDELGYAYPVPKDDRFHAQLKHKNLATIWPNYKAAGVKMLIIPSVVENHKELERFHQDIPDAKILTVRLDASQSVLEERIQNRPMGGDEEWHLKRSAELTDVLEEAKIEDVLINTEAKSISEVAQEVVENWTAIEAVSR